MIPLEFSRRIATFTCIFRKRVFSLADDSRSRISIQNASAIIANRGHLSASCPSSPDVWISRGSPLSLLQHAIIRGYGERKSVHGQREEKEEEVEEGARWMLHS